MYFPQIVWLDFEYKNEHYEGEAIPAYATFSNSTPAFDIYFNNEYNGTLFKNNNNWTCNNYLDTAVVRIIGNKLLSCAID